MNNNVTIGHHQILVQKFTIRSNFYPRSSNKLIGENEGLYVLDLLWKMAMGSYSYRKWRAEVTGSEKIYF